MVRGRPEVIAIETEEGVRVHCTSDGGNYATLCGMDGDDSEVGQRPANLPRSHKITCDQCFAIFMKARKYRLSDFAKVFKPVLVERDKGRASTNAE